MIYSTWVIAMRKKKSNLREFEKKNRIIDLDSARKKRKERLAAQKDINEGQRKKVKINYVRIVASAMILIFIVYFGVYAFKIIKLNQERKNVMEYNQELLQTKERLEIELKNINTPNYLESQARRELKLVKPNELLFIFSDDEYTKDEEDSEEK